MQCESDVEVECPEAHFPPVIRNPASFISVLFTLTLDSVGAHGFFAFFCGLLLLLGFIKLSCGGIICCRKTKAQEHAERLQASAQDILMKRGVDRSDGKCEIIMITL